MIYRREYSIVTYEKIVSSFRSKCNKLTSRILDIFIQQINARSAHYPCILFELFSLVMEICNKNHSCFFHSKSTKPNVICRKKSIFSFNYTKWRWKHFRFTRFGNCFLLRYNVISFHFVLFIAHFYCPMLMINRI